MPRIRFEPTGRLIETPNEELSVSEAAERAGMPLDSVCGGRGTCGRCRVVVTSEEPPITEEDRRLIPPEDLEQGARLACRMKVTRDLVIEIPSEFIRARQIILEDSFVSVESRPMIRRVSVKVDLPSLDCPTGDFERLHRALEGRVNEGRFTASLPVISSLPKLLRSRTDLYAILRGDELLHLTSDMNQGKYGVAVDVGTTTVVAYLMNLDSGEEMAVESDMNPQMGHGDDVLSRMTFAMENRYGRSILQSSIVQCINKLIDACCASVNISREDVFEVVVVGNTAMHHMLFGLDTIGLALSPYVPVVADSLEVKAREVGVFIGDEGYVSSLPNVAGFVGADHVAVLLASRLWESEDPKLVIDIGTNGEISVGNSDGIASTSCAAGPAFEGANLSFGMRGTDGAIDHLSISDDLDVSYTTINGLKPKGLCGSGVVDAIAEMFRTGVIERNGRIREELGSPRIRVVDGESQFIVATRDETSMKEPIVITQNDIVQIQYAKAAMYAGTSILMERMKINSSKLDAILLAGAFGNYVRPASARIIGLFPEIPLDRIMGIGNAAGAGAKMALLNEDVRKKARELATSIEYVELAAHAQFEDRFYNALYFPNYDTSFFPQVMSEISST